MVDGRGQARITDFGLAGVAEHIAGAEIASGTPAYMAPEQLAGEAVSVKNDLYALGLVLFELFTGRQAHRAGSRLELQRLHEESAPADPASHQPDLDRRIARVIRRCLERDPEERPDSALAVAAALPGEDPLAAALAAGEVPSPEVVAGAGERGGLRAATGLACLALIVAGLLAAAGLYGRRNLAGRVALEKPPEALAVEARDLLAELGYAERPQDRAWGFEHDLDHLRFLREEVGDGDKWWTFGEWPSPIVFWYRESPSYLEPFSFTGALVTQDDPPATLSGMATVRLDPAGRLRQLFVVPPQATGGEAATAEPDWRMPFEGAGLDPTDFSPAEPARTPPVYSDLRRAWRGSHSAWPGLTVRVEATAHRGRVVSFETLLPWSDGEPPAADPKGPVFPMVMALILVVILAGAVFLARINLRRGAWRLAAFWFVSTALFGLFGAAHVPTVGEIRLLLLTASWGLLGGAMVWLV